MYLLEFKKLRILNYLLFLILLVGRVADKVLGLF